MGVEGKGEGVTPLHPGFVLSLFVVHLLFLVLLFCFIWPKTSSTNQSQKIENIFFFFFLTLFFNFFFLFNLF